MAACLPWSNPYLILTTLNSVLTDAVGGLPLVRLKPPNVRVPPEFSKTRIRKEVNALTRPCQNRRAGESSRAGRSCKAGYGLYVPTAVVLHKAARVWKIISRQKSI
jgi:hypothetical protein